MAGLATKWPQFSLVVFSFVVGTGSPAKRLLISERVGIRIREISYVSPSQAHQFQTILAASFIGYCTF